MQPAGPGSGQQRRPTRCRHRPSGAHRSASGQGQNAPGAKQNPVAGTGNDVAVRWGRPSQPPPGPHARRQPAVPVSCGARAVPSGVLSADVPMLGRIADPPGGALVTAPRTRHPQALDRPACTPAAIRAVLAATVGPAVLQRYDQDLDAAFEQAREHGDLTPWCRPCGAGGSRHRRARRSAAHPVLRPAR